MQSRRQVWGVRARGLLLSGFFDPRQVSIALYETLALLQGLSKLVGGHAARAMLTLRVGAASGLVLTPTIW